MQQANEGLLKMKGYKDQSFQGAFDIESTESGDLEAALLGSRVSAHDIKEKQQKLEEIKAFNFFSSLGSNIGDFLTLTFQKIIHFFISTIDRIVTSLG